MKKIMIALLVVASIFVLASCAQAPISTPLTLESKDCEAKSANASALVADGAKAYTKDSSGVYSVITTKALKYGTLKVEDTEIVGSSQASWKFTYTGAEGKNGTEDVLTVYIGVLNSDGKSFKTQCATVTVNAKAVWTGEKPVDVVLSNETGKNTDTKVLLAEGASILVDGNAYTYAVAVKTAAGAEIGTLAVEFGTGNKEIKFTFTDMLDQYAASVVGAPNTVVVKNGTVTVGTYEVVCSHIASPAPSYVDVPLIAVTQAEYVMSSSCSLSTSEKTLVLWKKNASGVFENEGYISTDPAVESYLSYNVENETEDIISKWTVGTVLVESVGKKGEAISGIRFTLDTRYDEYEEDAYAGGNGALGAGTAEYDFILKTTAGVEVQAYKVSAIVAPKYVAINNVIAKGSLSSEYFSVMDSSVKNVWYYNEDAEKWYEIPSDGNFVPVYDSEKDDIYVGKVKFDKTEQMLVFSTESYTYPVSGNVVIAAYGKGALLIGLNKNDVKYLFEGELSLKYQNVEVSSEVSTVIKAKSSETDKGIFWIDAEKGDQLYCRYATSYEKGYQWSAWFDSETLSSLNNKFNYYKSGEASLLSSGEFLYINSLTAGGFKCRFDSEGNTNYGKTGYYEFAKVNENGYVLETYWIEGTNEYE